MLAPPPGRPVARNPRENTVLRLNGNAANGMLPVCSIDGTRVMASGGRGVLTGCASPSSAFNQQWTNMSASPMTNVSLSLPSQPINPRTPQPQPVFYPAGPGPKFVRNGCARTRTPQAVHTTLRLDPDRHIRRVRSPDFHGATEPPRQMLPPIRTTSLPAIMSDLYVPSAPSLHSEEHVRPRRNRRKR